MIKPVDGSESQGTNNPMIVSESKEGNIPETRSESKT